MFSLRILSNDLSILLTLFDSSLIPTLDLSWDISGLAMLLINVVSFVLKSKFPFGAVVPDVELYVESDVELDVELDVGTGPVKLTPALFI